MSNSTINRVQAGVPSGGQFAATSHSEPAISLGGTPAYARPSYNTVFYRSRGEYQADERVTVGDLLKPSVNGWDTRFEESTGHIVATKDESTFVFRPLPGQEPQPTGHLPAAGQDVFDDSDLDACTECGDDTSDNEGYDGLCGNCADKAYGEDYDEDADPNTATVDPPRPGPFAHRTVQFHAAHNAVVNGTARQQLKDDFERAGISHEQLAEAVGHSPRVARRIVEGKEFLLETTVAVYFEALDHQPTHKDIENHQGEQERFKAAGI